MRIIIKDVIKLLKGYSKQQVLGIVLTVLCTVSTIAAPIASSYLIDKVIPSYDMKQLIYGIGIFFVICLLNPLFSYPRSSIYNKMTQDITASLREMLFEKVILAPMSFFDQHQNGEIINHVLNDSQQMGQFITNFFTNYIMDIGLIVMSLIGMIFISPSVSGLAIIVFALAFLCNELFRKRMSEVSHKIQKDYDALNVDISQAVNIVETIKSYTLEANVIKHYLGNVKACKDDCVKVNQYNIKINTFMQSIYVVCICLIYGFGTYRVMNKQMTLGEVVAINLLFQNFISPIYSLANNLVAINQIRPVFNRVFEYLNMQQEPLKLEEDSKEIIKGPIQIQDVKFRYKKNGRWVINEMNLTFPERGLIGIIGESGSGKSTFIKLLLRLYEGEVGKIYVQDRELQSIALNQLRQAISYVPQDVDLFNGTIRENIMAYGTNMSEAEMIHICERLNMHQRIMSLPEQYNSMISERINLSGGEKQRLGIARALAKKSLIYVFDEPTSSLDQENSQFIKEIIEDLSKKYLVIVIEHRLETFENADHIYQFQNGKLVDIDELEVTRDNA